MVESRGRRSENKRRQRRRRHEVRLEKESVWGWIKRLSTRSPYPSFLVVEMIPSLSPLSISIFNFQFPSQPQIPNLRALHYISPTRPTIYTHLFLPSPSLLWYCVFVCRRQSEKRARECIAIVILFFLELGFGGSPSIFSPLFSLSQGIYFPYIYLFRSDPSSWFCLLYF